MKKMSVYDKQQTVMNCYITEVKWCQLHAQNELPPSLKNETTDTDLQDCFLYLLKTPFSMFPVIIP